MNDITFFNHSVIIIIKNNSPLKSRNSVKLNTIIMNKLTEPNENWNIIKGKLKQKFGMLTESDLLYTEGKQEEMLNRLQTKLGRTKAEIRKIITEL